MKFARITITMKMGLAAVVTITTNMRIAVSVGMSTVMSRNTSTAMTKRAAAAKLILMKNMNMMPAAVKNMSTIITAAAVGMSTTTNISMAKAVVVVNIITMNTKMAAAADMNIIIMNTRLVVAADMNIITATTFRVTRRTVSAKSAIRTKNTVTCAAKALKTAPAVCRTLTA